MISAAVLAEERALRPELAGPLELGGPERRRGKLGRREQLVGVQAAQLVDRPPEQRGGGFVRVENHTVRARRRGSRRPPGRAARGSCARSLRASRPPRRCAARSTRRPSASGSLPRLRRRTRRARRCERRARRGCVRPTRAARATIDAAPGVRQRSTSGPVVCRSTARSPLDADARRASPRAGTSVLASGRSSPAQTRKYASSSSTVESDAPSACGEQHQPLDDPAHDGVDLAGERRDLELGTEVAHEISPSRSAVATACVRVDAPSRLLALRTCVRTVSEPIPSRRAISSCARPSASSRAPRARAPSVSVPTRGRHWASFGKRRELEEPQAADRQHELAGGDQAEHDVDDVGIPLAAAVLLQLRDDLARRRAACGRAGVTSSPRPSRRPRRSARRAGMSSPASPSG